MTKPSVKDEWITRRGFIRGTVGSSIPFLLPVPFLEIFLNVRGAKAAGNAKRFIAVYSPDGTGRHNSGGNITKHDNWGAK